MPKQVLDAMTERSRGTGAPGARATHLQIDHTILKAAKDDIAAIMGHGGPNARIKQFLDGENGFVVRFVEKFFLIIIRCASDWS
jgi:hypothetical protein